MTKYKTLQLTEAYCITINYIQVPRFDFQISFITPSKQPEWYGPANVLNSYNCSIDGKVRFSEQIKSVFVFRIFLCVGLFVFEIYESTTL